MLLCDAGRQRNRRSHALHGYLTRDGTPPADFLRLAREELAGYDGVELCNVVVKDAEHLDPEFSVTLEDGERVLCRTLLLATGVVDQVPVLDGIEPLYGVSVHHCPYCDGWEHRDQPLAVYGPGPRAKGLALALTQWSRDVVFCSDGPTDLEEDDRERLRVAGVVIREEPVRRLEGRDGRLEQIVFQDGQVLARSALFFATEQSQGCDLPDRLGCGFTAHGAVDTGKAERTQTPGLFVAGDASTDAQLVIVAAAEGVEAAVAINTLLTKLDLGGESEGGSS